MTAASPALISVDWGTTSLRCWLLAPGGEILDASRTERGILKTDGLPFPAVLHQQIAPWLERFDSDGTKVPVVMSGMIGSQQGWQEAAYLRCPASPSELANALAKVDTSSTDLADCDIHIVPGMDLAGDDEEGELPDVMRGEETQVLGALLAADQDTGVFVLPGTHSKWVFVENGSITEFRTFMTGEIYAALLDTTILGRLAEPGEHDDDAFTKGVNTALVSDDWAGPGNLLNMVFSARTRVLHGELEKTAVKSYLSGLLIGAEILSGADAAWFAVSELNDREDANLQIIGETELQKRYAEAARIAGLQAQSVTGNTVPIAHLEIAKLAGLVA